jgi:hypothetical protein
LFNALLLIFASEIQVEIDHKRERRERRGERGEEREERRERRGERRAPGGISGWWPSETGGRPPSPRASS